MVCPKCGTENQDGNRYCTNCKFDFSANWGNQSNQSISNQQLQNDQNTCDNYQVSNNKTGSFHSHLAMSIVAIFFITILGIVATVMSNQANKAYKIGDFAQAESKAKTAMILSIISYVLGGLFIIAQFSTH